MKGIIKDIVFVAVTGILGAASGLGIASILNAIAMPNIANLLLTLREKADLEASLKGMLMFLGSHVNTMMAVLAMCAIICFFLVLLELNPNFTAWKKAGFNRKKVIVATIASAVLLLLLAASLTRFPMLIVSGIIPATFPNTGIATLGFLMVILSGALWIIAGETGWAGDFTSWGFRSGWRSGRTGAAATFFMGAACGGIAYCLFILFNWSFDRYFLLVSEVFGGSGEPTFSGMKLLSWALVVLLGFSFAIISGFVTVLAPRRMTIKARLLRLVIPAVLLAIYAPIIAGMYHNAVVQYDLNKKNLAEAVGIPEKGRLSKTVVLFVPEKPAVQEWLMEASGNGLMISNNTYALTPENIGKIEDYLSRHGNGSIFFYAGSDAAMKGYYKLWETDKGNERMFRNANHQFIARMVLLARLRSIPVTAENEKYLRSFSDETKWHAGKTASLRIAEAFMHFGSIDDAKTWADKAKAKGEDPGKSRTLSEPVLTNASVTGTIKLNGAPLAGKKVALFPYRQKMSRIDPRYFYGFPLDAKTTDPSGRFEFSNLGKGEYVLAVMTEKEEVPFKVPAENFSVENSPGVIALDSAAPVKNLYGINIVVQK